MKSLSDIETKYASNIAKIKERQSYPVILTRHGRKRQKSYSEIPLFSSEPRASPETLEEKRCEVVAPGDEPMCDEKEDQDPPSPGPPKPNTQIAEIVRALVFGFIFIGVAYLIKEESDYARPLV